MNVNDKLHVYDCRLWSRKNMLTYNIAGKNNKSVTNGTYRFRYCNGFEHTCPDFSSGNYRFSQTLSSDCKFTNLDEKGDCKIQLQIVLITRTSIDIFAFPV